jgi:plastocyanin
LNKFIVTTGIIGAILIAIVFALIYASSNVNAKQEHQPAVSIVNIDMVEVRDPNVHEFPQFVPRNMTVLVGLNNTVRWINNTPIPNAVIPDNPSIENFTSHDSRYANEISLLSNGTFDYTFTKPGTYNYHSTPHPWMSGTILVLPSDIRQ